MLKMKTRKRKVQLQIQNNISDQSVLRNSLDT